MSAPTDETRDGGSGSVEEIGSGAESVSAPSTPPLPSRTQRGSRRTRQQQRSGNKNLGLEKLPVDDLPLSQVTDTAQGAASGVTNALGGVANTAVDKHQQGQQVSEQGGKSDTLRLRLDLNLDIEITLKARIHGDLELALLTG